jgi:hypothetical protein
MRELEFLPTWYPNLRRKRRVIVFEAWLALGIFACLGVWLILSAHSVIAQESLLTVRQQQLTQSNYDLQKLAELQSLKLQMSEQAKLMARLGPNVPMARLMDTIEQQLPKGIALRDVTVEFQKGLKPQTARNGAVTSEPQPSYVVNIHGVSPSDVELGDFMTRLAKTIPHWVGGAMGETDAHEEGHLLRDFNFSFSMRLNEGEGQAK